MKSSVLAIALAIGCGGSSTKPVQEPSPQPVAQKPAPTCAAVGGHLTAMLPRWGATADEAKQIAAVYDLRCNEDRWKPEGRECFGTMAVDTDVIKCDQVLDPDQRVSLTEALAPLRQDLLIADLEGFATQACNCNAGDTACANKVSEDMTKWAEAQAATAPQIKPGDTRAEVIGKRLSECITKAMTPVQPAAPAAKPAPERKTRGGAKPKPVPKSSSDPDLGGE